MDPDYIIIINTLKGFPDGLGFNELFKILEKHMAHGTLKKRLDDLKSYRFIRQEPETARRGQKTKIYSTNAYKEYESFLERLDNQTNFLIKQFGLMKIESETDVKILNNIIKSIIRNYSMPFLFDSIQSWDPNWVYNAEIVKEVLLIVYASFIQVKEKLDIILKNPEYKKHIDKFTKKQLEKLNKLEEKNPINTILLDEVDLFTFNLVNTRKSSLKKKEKFQKKI